MSSPSNDGDSDPDFSFLGGVPDTSDAQGFNFDEVGQQSAAVDRTTPAAPRMPAEPRHDSTAAAGDVVESPAAKKAPSANSSRPVKKKARVAVTANANAVSDGDESFAANKKFVNALLGYAAALTLLFLILLLTGRLSLFGGHPLESLPDIKPLRHDEFQLVPPTASLPRGHSLQLGESQRFGDIILTAERVTFEPLKFAHMISGEEATDLEQAQALKLWFKVENVASDIAFSPWSVGLMCHHSQRGTDIASDEDMLANSWLMVKDASNHDEIRVLNFMHSPTSSFNLVRHGGDALVFPGESQTCFVVASQAASNIKSPAEAYRWRIQIRKGVNRASGNGVTTLVDITFQPNQIESINGA